MCTTPSSHQPRTDIHTVSQSECDGFFFHIHLNIQPEQSYCSQMVHFCFHHLLLFCSVFFIVPKPRNVFARALLFSCAPFPWSVNQRSGGWKNIVRMASFLFRFRWMGDARSDTPSICSSWICAMVTTFIWPSEPNVILPRGSSFFLLFEFNSLAQRVI